MSTRRRVDRGAGTARHPAPRRRRWSRTAGVALLVSVGALVLLTAAAGLWVRHLTTAADRAVHRWPPVATSELSPTEPTPGPGRTGPAAARSTGTNILVLGSDSTDPDRPAAGRSDTMILVHLSADGGQATLVSFPRDLWVPIPGHGRGKINAAFAYGGPALSARTVAGLLDVPVDHVVAIDFTGLTEIVDEVGGVTVDNPWSSAFDGHRFPRGPVRLDGPAALAFVRERKDLPRGDLDRAERQRLVLSALATRVLSPRWLADPAGLDRLVRTAAGHLTADSGLRMAVLRDAALRLALSNAPIGSLQVPIAGFGETPDGESVDRVDEVGLAALGEAIRRDRLAEYLRSHPNG